MTWKCRRCARSVDPLARDETDTSLCAACALHLRAEGRAGSDQAAGADVSIWQSIPPPT